MPVYDYRCNACGRKSPLMYKTIAAYDEARNTGTLTCPHCGAHDLTRLISRVAIPRPAQNYANMSPEQMVSVLEGGNSREVGEMFRQVGGDEAASDPQMAEVTDRLLRGESPDKIERDMSGSTPPSAAEGGSAGVD